MKPKHQFHHDQNQHPVNIPALPAKVVVTQHNGVDFGPSKHEISQRAYDIYLSQGSLPGYDIQHWQEAEAQLVEERNCTLARGVPKLSIN